MATAINGKRNTFKQKLTVQRLLEKVHVGLREYITVQISDKILKREDFDSITIHDGDCVELPYHMSDRC